jgi:hypothetical protein
MSKQHNPERYGELWPQHKIDAGLNELRAVQSGVIISGGWAWHFMSPPGHPEYKHAHDHKDIDLFAPPAEVASVVGTLKANGFERVWTKYDRFPSEEDFRRYEKVFEPEGSRSFRIAIDFFVRSEVPYREIEGWKVVEPDYLLSLYSDIHGSGQCFAVRAAARLLAHGIDPVGRSELVEFPAG